MYVYDDDNNVNRVIWKPRNRYPKAEKTFQKWKSTHSSIWQQNQPKYPMSLYISPVLNFLSKLYTPSTLNMNLILWHTHLNVCAVK